MTDDDDQKSLFTSHMPVTHLYLGEAISESIMAQISKQCPQLIELVIAAYGSGPIDRFLISVAKGCSQLSAVGLGDCEITYVDIIFNLASLIHIIYQNKYFSTAAVIVSENIVFSIKY